MPRRRTRSPPSRSRSPGSRARRCRAGWPLGPRAGAPVERLGGDPDAPWVESARPLQARRDGFDLHAGVTVPGEDRERLEQLCRYLLRPPIAQERLTLRPDGTVLVTLKTPWRDGTTHLRFAPMTLLERLAALTPRPRINMLIYHGILAPRAASRAAAVAYGRADRGEASVGDGARTSSPAKVPMPCEPTAGSTTRSESAGSVAAATAVPAAAISGRGPVSPDPALPPAGAPRSRHRSWAELLRRVFAVDVLACPRCGGRMRVIALIDDPSVVRRILAHLGILGDASPPRGPWPRRAA